jgi:hypothetical protein
MATLATTQLSPVGINPDTPMVAAAAGGDKVRPGPNVFLRVKNAGGGSINVVIDDPNSAQPTGSTAWNPDITVAVTNGQERWIGPLSAERFAAAADGLVAVTYSGVTSVTVGAFDV